MKAEIKFDNKQIIERTEFTRNRYNHFASIYDYVDIIGEYFFAPWRKEIWQRLKGLDILEIGVGTGQNLKYYPEGKNYTAIDLSEKMLEKAKKYASKNKIPVKLLQADIHSLPFEDNSFDTVIGTLVFCGVADYSHGLKEVQRVLKPGGQLLLFEHVLSHKKGLRLLMNFLNPVFLKLIGESIDHKTDEKIKEAGFENIRINNLWLDIFKLIEAYSPKM